MLELQDLFDSYELMVWSFMDVEIQEFLFYSPRQCHSSRNSSSDQCDIDAHLLTYLSVLNSHQLISSQLSLSMVSVSSSICVVIIALLGSVKLACTVVLPAYMEAEVKAELNKKAHSVVIFMSGSSYGYAWWWMEMARSLRLALVDHHRKGKSRLEKLVEVPMYSPMEVRKVGREGQGEVKGGGVDFGVINSLLGEILGEVMGEME
ncbi:hypothetical protein Tco_0235794 [Tanacetum coccineum]